MMLFLVRWSIAWNRNARLLARSFTLFHQTMKDVLQPAFVARSKSDAENGSYSWATWFKENKYQSRIHYSNGSHVAVAARREFRLLSTVSQLGSWFFCNRFCKSFHAIFYCKILNRWVIQYDLYLRLQLAA